MTLKKYNEVMEHIRVTEEMQERILGKIEKEELVVRAEKKRPVSYGSSSDGPGDSGSADPEGNHEKLKPGTEQ